MLIGLSSSCRRHFMQPARLFRSDSLTALESDGIASQATSKFAAIRQFEPSVD